MPVDPNPYAGPLAASALGLAAGLELTWMRATKIWWSLLWRTVVFSALLGVLVGAIVGIALAALNFGTIAIAIIAQVLGTLGSIPIAVAVTRHVLGKSWSDFRIVLVTPAR
jgi:hypothetical protein